GGIRTMFGWSDPSPYFSAKQRGGVLVVFAHGPEIRHPEPASEFGADLLKLVEKHGHKAILIDLTKMRYLSSTRFTVLLRTADNIQAAGGRLKICGLHPDVAIGANIIGLGRLVDIFPDEDEALASF